MQFQHHGVVHGAGQDRAAAAWDGPALAAKQGAEPARPVLPGGCVLHAGAPGGQAPAPHCLKKPPQVLLNGQRPECQDDARPFLLPHHQLHPQKEQPPQSEACPPTPEPTQKLHQKQLQNFLRQALKEPRWNLSQRNSVLPLAAGGCISDSGFSRQTLLANVCDAFRVMETHYTVGLRISMWMCMKLLFSMCVYKGKISTLLNSW